MEHLSILTVLVCFVVFSDAVTDPTENSCFGTSSGLSVGEDRVDHYSKMAQRYRGCKIVKGNLEITALENPEIDTSIFKDIEEVTGYVIISLNFVPYLPLEKLRIIRGRELFREKYALVISLNNNGQDENQGLKELRLKSLTEIVSGGVIVRRNHQLCFTDTINWSDILHKATREAYDIEVEPPPTTCGSCDASCNGSCWGQGPTMCQRLTSTICASKCGNSRCKGPEREDCCAPECASGCTGPSDRDCITCLHVNNSGSCEYACPSAHMYDPQTERNIRNPFFKYHYNDHCVDECPSNLLVEENGCVKSCRKQFHDDGTGVCVPCTEELCSGNKECYGIAEQGGPLASIKTINSTNIHLFEGCNTVVGNVVFQSYVFAGDNHTGLAPINISQLEVFRTVKTITGYLKIMSWPRNLTDFSIFENLETITGIRLYKDLAAIVIQDIPSISGDIKYLDQIQSLGFRSLKSIRHGNVYIGYLTNLCYDRTINWTLIIEGPKVYRGFVNGLLLRKNKKTCGNVSELCHAECNGCWGPGADSCHECLHFSFNGTCLPKCHKEMGIATAVGETECLSCDSECEGTCHGAGPRNCTKCRRYNNNGTCTSLCPRTKYPDHFSKECLPCHENCALHGNERKCKGPGSTLGIDGCHRCHVGLTTRGFDTTECIPRGSDCPVGYFWHESQIVLSKKTCMPCYEGCRNCTGINREDCMHALSTEQEVAIAIAVPLVVVTCIFILILFFGCRHRRKVLKRKQQRSIWKLGIDGHSPEEQNVDPRARLMEPMTPSGVAPNQAQLRIVKEAELRIGKILGSGAFGTVHKGYWIPDLAPRERVKVPVAIKVLRDESSQVASNEILDEAFVMASCEHPNLVRLLGISLSQRIMLITQLMPLGNLLEYVRDNKDNIGSQHMLNWSLQIAKGMRYLSEEKHLVHRDLAARNVLVKSPNHVRITDFGLAKLLDVKEDVYRAEGGKMPIKWLALESIQHRIFTQKSDVWSFGITMWELMTFGKKPYENVPAREVHTLLERGERLPQPYVCTIDIYMLLIKCWTVDAEARPTFRELSEELSKMARDPQRYVVIDNDGLLNDLPSPTTSEFLRSLMHDEGDDFPITDAEEYLHPQPQDGDEATADPNQFSLQPVPAMVPWKRQHHQHPLSSTSSQQGLLGRGSGRFMHGPAKTSDRRLDSVMTTMTNLSSVSGSLPNGASTPGLNSELDDGHEIVLGATGNSRGIVMHYTPISTASNNFQAFQDSDAVFIPSNLDKHPPGARSNQNGEDCAEPPRVTRAREDSTTLRYSAEPVSLMRQQTKPNEYLDPSDFPPSPFALKPPVNIFDTLPPSAIANPEYEPSFIPSDSESGTAGVTQDTFEEILEDDREYENIVSMVPNPMKVVPEQHGQHLTALGLRHGSHSDESTNSEKRDSGMQTDDEDVKKNDRATSVANPEYDFLGDDSSGGGLTQFSGGFPKNETEYVNNSVIDPNSNPAKHPNGYADDEIFTGVSLADPKTRERILCGKNSIGRTYSEPDSGVGIEVAVDNILYHKLGPAWDTHE